MSDHAATAAHAFRRAFEQRDFAPAAATLAGDVVFRSPVLARPWRTRPVLEQLGASMVGVFGEQRFAPVVAGADRAYLSWTGTVGELDAEGVLVLDVSPSGTVTDLAILIRPLSALQAVAASMGAALDPQLLAEHQPANAG